MKIILVIEDKKDRSAVLVSDSFNVISLNRAIELARQYALDGLHIMHRLGREYLRRNPTYKGVYAIEQISVSFPILLDAVNNPAVFFTRSETKEFWKLYQHSTQARVAGGETPIVIEGRLLATEERVREILLPYQQYIVDAALKFSLDPYLLGAIFIDEIARLAPLEEARDMVAALSVQWDVSVGIAQVKIETARGLIRDGYYNPNKKDPNLSEGQIDSTLRSHIYRYVSEPRHNVFFGAAKMQSDIDTWSNTVDISNRPEIIATLYSAKPKTPHIYPKPNERGMQVATEFYKLAKRFLQ